VYDLVLEKRLLTEAELKHILQPAMLTKPRLPGMLHVVPDLNPLGRQAEDGQHTAGVAV
jgi:hypothetical protein